MKKEEINEGVMAQVEARIQELEKSISAKKRPKALASEIKRLKSVLHKTYIEYKQKTMNFEKDNRSSLVFLRSTNGFHKIFGNSLFFYVFDIVLNDEL